MTRTALKEVSTRKVGIIHKLLTFNTVVYLTLAHSLSLPPYNEYNKLLTTTVLPFAFYNMCTIPNPKPKIFA